MAESSYNKIYKRLAETPEGRAIEQKYRRQIDEVRVLRIEFRLEMPDQVGKPATAEAKYVVQTLGQDRATTTLSHGTQPWLYCRVEDAEARDIVKRHLGVDVPRCFCREDIMLGEAKSAMKGRQRRQETFRTWFQDWLNAKLSDEIHLAKERVLRQMDEANSSPETAALREQFMKDEAIRCVKIALSAFSHLGDKILKEAIDEFVVHELCIS